jgi:hypothetical protein
VSRTAFDPELPYRTDGEASRFNSALAGYPTDPSPWIQALRPNDGYRFGERKKVISALAAAGSLALAGTPTRGSSVSDDMIVVRYADDQIVGFEHEHEAKAFLHDLHERLRAFELALHPDKTRLIRFGRHAAEQRARLGEGKPETFVVFDTATREVTPQGCEGALGHDG